MHQNSLVSLAADPAAGLFFKCVRWEPYDPRWLVALAEVQHRDKPWLAAALSACTLCQRDNSKKYIRFVDAGRANKAGAAWQFKETMWLEDSNEGKLLLDILEDERVGGIEFYDRLFTAE